MQADQVRHYRNCSSRNLFWHKKQRCLAIRTSCQNLIPWHRKQVNNRSSKKDHQKDLTRFYKIIMQEFPLRIPQEFPMRIPEELSYKHQCRASSRSECKDLLLVRILQDLDTISSQEPPTRVFIKAPLRYGICKLLMQGPYREDLTRISTRSSDKDLCKIM